MKLSPARKRILDEPINTDDTIYDEPAAEEPLKESDLHKIAKSLQPLPGTSDFTLPVLEWFSKHGIQTPQTLFEGYNKLREQTIAT